ncbi:hypothetical protein CC86DRAFT_113524 [Ophiobolus disseminans]|uniref:MYND-type domain-containing protein n=1 Tax=Ophiobolus disseminans TaxID=1469910 RepID=A0A6A6ZIB9_9PLEO|nr:hypothetical protein CC86DRAFT_113524 [Ophiobolus disseminans]
MSSSTKPTPALLCLRCNKVGVKQCSSCANARYCSTQCQKQDWKQHKIICGAFQALEERPSPKHIRAILFPIDDDKPRFVWITRYTHWFYDLKTEWGPLLGNPQSHESQFFGQTHGLRRPLVGAKDIMVEYNSTFALDDSPSNQSMLKLAGMKQPRRWCRSFIAHGYYEENGKLVDTVDVNTNDFGALMEHFNSRVDTIPKCCLPGSWRVCAEGRRNTCRKNEG